MKKRRKLSNPHKSRNIYIGIICSIIFVVYFLSIGYSTNSASARIENLMASIQPQAYARITNVTVTGSTNEGLSSAENYNLSNIYGTVELPNANSTVTYKIDVTVFLSSEMLIRSITGLNENLDYELTDYTIGSVLCNNNGECNFGATKEFYLTIKYKNNGYNSSNTTYPFNIEFLFESNSKVAKIGTRYFDTLQAAVNAVSANNELVTIYLLNNTSEKVIIAENKRIDINLQGFIVSNKGNLNCFANDGNLHLINGSIVSDASTQGAINNNSKGTMVLQKVTVLMSGGRQALYNDKGTATITGGSYLSSSASARGAVQNVSPGNLTIEDAKIVSTEYHAVDNAGTLTLGVQDGVVDTTKPELIGYNSGLRTTTQAVYFYDGILKGISNSSNNLSNIRTYETGYTLSHNTEIIDGVEYKTTTLGVSVTFTYHANGGTVSPATQSYVTGAKPNNMPTPVLSGHQFLGWYTANDELVDENTIIQGSLDLYAHWLKNTGTAQIGDVLYDTLQEAINAVPNNTPTTIQMLKNSNETITVARNKNITIDLGTATLTNSGTHAVIDNYGTLNIINGTITSNASSFSAVDNREGHLTIDSTTIRATGGRQAVYVYEGTVEIKGTAYLTSNTDGIPSGSAIERGTVHNLAPGTLIITGGTIVGEKQQAVSNLGSLTIGTKDGTVSTTSPMFIGAVYGVKSTTDFNFYDGIMKGKLEAYLGLIDDKETSYDIATGQETVGNDVYLTAYLDSE